jgi:hypothetical protein
MMLLHRLDISKASGYAVSTKTINSVHKMTREAMSVVLYHKQGLLQLQWEATASDEALWRNWFFGTTLQSSCNFYEHALVTLTNLQKK